MAVDTRTLTDTEAIACAVVPRERVPSPWFVSAGRGGGLARLCASLIRMRRLEGARIDGLGYRFEIPTDAAHWLVDRSLLWRYLSATISASGTTGQAPLARTVDSSELLATHDDGVMWHCRLEARDGATNATNATGATPLAVSWLIREMSPSGTSQPGTSLAVGLQNLRDVVGAALPGRGAPSLTVRPQSVTAISGGRALVRIDSAQWQTYWPVGAVSQLLHQVGGPTIREVIPGEASRAVRQLTVQHLALLRLLDTEITAHGLARVLISAPRNGVERRARYAIRTVRELARAGGVVPRVTAETAYRSGARYQDVATLILWLSEEAREAFRMGLGTRRWTALADHARARRADTGATPWESWCHAAESIVRDIADRTRQPGSPVPAAARTIVESYYVRPRSDTLRAVWNRQRESNQMRTLLQSISLERLRRIGSRIPRETLVRSVVGESIGVQERLAAIFSRRGAERMVDDIRALRGAIDRGEFREWDELLSARATVIGTLSERTRRTVEAGR